MKSRTLNQLLLKCSIFLLSIGLWQCQSSNPTPTTSIVTVNPMDRLPDNQAGEVVRKAIEHVGGWEQWDDKEAFSFYKNITQLDSTGQEIKTTRQLQQYRIKPHFGARMTWKSGGKDYVIVNNGNQAWKYENGKELTDEKSKKEAWNSSFGSNYVIFMPFKLTDPGAILSYDGLDTLDGNKIVHAVKVKYEKGAGSSGGFHTWWYYFDKESYDLVANYLDYGTGYSYTSYQTFRSVNGIRMHDLRYSHASDATKKIGRKKTIYANEKMQFNTSLADSLFEPIAQ